MPKLPRKITKPVSVYDKYREFYEREGSSEFTTSIDNTNVIVLHQLDRSLIPSVRDEGWRLEGEGYFSIEIRPSSVSRVQFEDLEEVQVVGR